MAKITKVTPYKKLSPEQKKVMINNVKYHRSIVQSWLFNTKEIKDDDAMPISTLA